VNLSTGGSVYYYAATVTIATTSTTINVSDATLQANDTLREQLIASFPDTPPELIRALDCPDYKESGLFDRFRDLFQKKKTSPDTSATKAGKKKRGFFNRLFGK
jgi:hypothetical protein